MYVVCYIIIFIYVSHVLFLFHFFFFNDTATTEIYTLSLHDALPIFRFKPSLEYTASLSLIFLTTFSSSTFLYFRSHAATDRKSTRLNSSHANISYAVFCLKKKKKKYKTYSFFISIHQNNNNLLSSI